MISERRLKKIRKMALLDSRMTVEEIKSICPYDNLASEYLRCQKIILEMTQELLDAHLTK
jgi:hypothetical protein